MSAAPRRGAVSLRRSNRDELELEGALQDAACMADIAFTFIGVGLGFEKLEPPKLTERDATLVYWMTSQVAHMIGLADKAFHEHEEASK